MNIIDRMGSRLCGYTYDAAKDEYVGRDMNKVESFYLNNKTLAVVSGAGLFIGGLGILAILASMGHLPALVGFLHAGAIPAHTMMIAGATTTAVGGGLTLSHLTMLGLKKYALPKLEEGE